MANKYETAEKIIVKLLEDNPQLREKHQDHILYMEYAKKVNPITQTLTFRFVMKNMDELGLYGFETIRRTRQRVQQKRCDLRGSHDSDQARAKEMEEVLEYVHK